MDRKLILRVIKLAICIIAALVPFLFERTSELFDSGTCTASEQPFKEFVFGKPLDYQHVTRPGYRNVTANLVQIVAIKEGREPGKLFRDPCLRRHFLAKLLAKVETVSRFVVIDYSLPPSDCAEDEELRTVLANAKTHIVIGKATLTRDEYLRTHPNAGGPELGEACLLESEEMALGAGSTPKNVKSGLLRFNQETSRIPLGWPVYSVRNGRVGELIRMPTLALVAAEEYVRMSSRRKNERLQQLLAVDEDPFTTFMTDDEIPTTAAIDVLCEKGTAFGDDWDHCTPPSNTPLGTNPIVVIGEDSTRDLHGGSPLGTVPGVLLHANYIESILEDRFLSTISSRTMLVATFVWVAIVEFAFFS